MHSPSLSANSKKGQEALKEECLTSATAGRPARRPLLLLRVAQLSKTFENVTEGRAIDNNPGIIDLIERENISQQFEDANKKLLEQKGHEARNDNDNLGEEEGATKFLLPASLTSCSRLMYSSDSSSRAHEELACRDPSRETAWHWRPGP